VVFRLGALAVSNASLARLTAPARRVRASVGGRVTGVGSAGGFVGHGASDANAFVTSSFAGDVTAVGVYLARRAGVGGAFGGRCARAVGVTGAFDAGVVDTQGTRCVAVAVATIDAFDAFVLFVGWAGFTDGCFAVTTVVVAIVTGDAFIVDAEICAAVRGVQAFDAGVVGDGGARFAVRD
jgi:hypothetical protein